MQRQRQGKEIAKFRNGDTINPPSRRSTVRRSTARPPRPTAIVGDSVCTHHLVRTPWCSLIDRDAAGQRPTNICEDPELATSSSDRYPCWRLCLHRRLSRLSTLVAPTMLPNPDPQSFHRRRFLKYGRYDSTDSFVIITEIRAFYSISRLCSELLIKYDMCYWSLAFRYFNEHQSEQTDRY